MELPLPISASVSVKWSLPCLAPKRHEAPGNCDLKVSKLYARTVAQPSQGSTFDPKLLSTQQEPLPVQRKTRQNATPRRGCPAKTYPVAVWYILGVQGAPYNMDHLGLSGLQVVRCSRCSLHGLHAGSARQQRQRLRTRPAELRAVRVLRLRLLVDEDPCGFH